MTPDGGVTAGRMGLMGCCALVRGTESTVGGGSCAGRAAVVWSEV